MSGTCLVKKGSRYHCDQCEAKGLKADFDYCPYCGEEISMHWDADNDCQITEAKPTTALESMVRGKS